MRKEAENYSITVLLRSKVKLRPIIAWLLGFDKRQQILEVSFLVSFFPTLILLLETSYARSLIFRVEAIIQ